MKRLSLTLSLMGCLAIAFAQNAAAADKIDFSKQIYPLLKEKCLSCHAAPYKDAKSGRTKKPKGGVRLDTVELIKAGYENDDDQKVFAFVAGKPEKSTAYTTAALPADHDDIMPPKGDPLTKAQLAMLKKWIADGADYGGFNAPAYVNPNAKKQRKGPLSTSANERRGLAAFRTPFRAATV